MLGYYQTLASYVEFKVVLRGKNISWKLSVICSALISLTNVKVQCSQ